MASIKACNTEDNFHQKLLLTDERHRYGYCARCGIDVFEGQTGGIFDKYGARLSYEDFPYWSSEQLLDD